MKRTPQQRGLIRERSYHTFTSDITLSRVTMLEIAHTQSANSFFPRQLHNVFLNVLDNNIRL